ncbi:hypothetical protein FSP39_004665 [Pinctada imbricata]|uniref:ATP-dependent DNA helicase n=1 Tax=Pinctada imbricata TaxID=66713 RepID=A0AA88YKU4_PINIB|nr:hypothetical protein FSP39_004665 [Pinctada imbricata]
MPRKANRRSKVGCAPNSDSNIDGRHSIPLSSQQNKEENPSSMLSLQQQIETQTASMGKDSPKQQNKKNNASMGLASPCEEMSLAAWRLASLCEKTPLNARGLAPPSGSRLSATDVSMPPSPDTPAWVCTPARVPSPKRGVAGQTQTGMRTHFMAMECRPSINVFLRKDARNIESTTKLNYETSTELNYETNTCTELNYETTLHSLHHMSSTTNQTERSKKQCSNITKAIQGNSHQGNCMFGENAGNQCVPNCLIAGIFGTLKSVHVWTSEDMDNILVTGNELYSFLRASSFMNHNHLLVHELPRQIDVFHTLYSIHIDESKISVISPEENVKQDMPQFNALPLDEAIKLSLEKYPTAFVCFAGSTVLIGRSEFGFFIYDPHSRSETGMIDIDGKSTCLLMTDIGDISENLYALGESMNVSGAIMIELTGFKLENVNSSSHKHIPNVQPHCGTENVSDDDDAVIYSCKEAPIKPDFKLLCKGTQRQICSKLHLKYENTKVYSNRLIKDAEKPKTWHRVMADGNCFFRALSFALSNTEGNHIKLRELVCEHALSQPDVFTSMLRAGHDSVLSYLETTKMREDCVWATEFEIYVASSMLKCTIYTFSDGTWIKFAMPSVDEKNIPDKNKIFLDHVNGNHYDVVLSTESETMTGQHNSNEFQGLKVIQRKRKDIKEKDALRKRLKKQDESIDEKNVYVDELNTQDKDIMKNSHVDKYVENSTLCDNTLQRNCKRKLLYKNDETYRETRKKMSRRTYEENDTYRASKKFSNKIKYKQNVEHRHEVKERSVMKYMLNEEHKNRVKEASVAKYRENEEHKNKVKEASVSKYRENEEHKNKVKEASVSKYKENAEHKEKAKLASLKKYKENELYKKKKKETSVLKYKENAEHRTKVKEKSISRYWEDANFRSKLKEQNLHMYQENEDFKMKAKRKSKLQNIKDERHKSRARQTAKEKYTTDKKYRSQRQECAKKAYASKIDKIPEMRAILSEKKKYQRILHIHENSDVHLIIANFKIKAEKGPDFTCACCKRLCFDNQVVPCSFDAYAKKGLNVTNAATMSITHNSEHSYSDEGQDECFKVDLKICHTCQRKIMAGCIPPESSSNNMSLGEIPDELKALNSLEENLIAKHITFMKLALLPQGAQNAIHGPVVCVPSNLSKAKSLPRQEDNDLILRVKLKRKLSYKGHYDYKFVNTSHVYNALQYLKENNKWYKDTDINQSEDEKDLLAESAVKEQHGQNGHTDDTNDCSNNRLDEIPPNENEPSEEYGVQYDTCLQPPDIGQEVLDHYFDEVFNIVPAEGMNPVKMLQEKGNEAKCFPILFPTGENSFDEARKLPISLSRYFNNRLMNADNRFAQHTNYLFYAQYLSELKQVIDKTQISLRKTTAKGASGENVTAETLQDKAKLKQLFRKDEALRFLQPIRGTPSYWQSAQKDLFAMLRQLGIPTWFCSFSAAEFRWKEIINTILKKQGDTRKFETLEWSEKCQILKSNPVTVARMFDRRFHFFLHEVILSPCNPIGKVNDYFLRVEFQQRGSPHMHCLFWIEDAPKLNENDEQTVCAFIDRYVTCELPYEKDQELHDIVQGVQQHSKKHSKSCRKKGTTCRFNFPRPPSSQTFIVSPLEEKTKNVKTKDFNTSKSEANDMIINEGNDSSLAETMTKTDAMEILRRVWDVIQSDSVSKSGTESLLEMIGTDQATYQQAQYTVATRQNIVLKRKPNEVWINQYNPTLLKCWDANMDIQFILDPFSCIVYVISYISKAEREMGMILKQTKIESEEGNLNAHQTMKAIGSAYLHHREVGVQEAVYRVCGLKMKESSRKVVFIPVGENPTRLSKPLSQLQGNKKREDKDDMINSDEDTEEIWILNVIDRYEARPNIQEFEQMCLAVFCSVFRVLSKSQVPKKQNVNVFKLRNDKGFIQRRVRSDHAVIRYPPTSISRDPEKHYRNILQLFLPYWTQNQLKPPGFDLYKSFCETGCVRFKDDKTLHKVQDVVDRNRDLFIKSEEALVEAQELYDLIGEPTDAWAMLCPESERSRDECRHMKSLNTADDGLAEDISDLRPEYKPEITYTIQGRNASKEEILPVLRSLNSKQSEVFYFVRDWCLKKLQGQNADPFHIFITGGAGTGKSHLIKAIKYEASRILAKVCEEPDQLTVLLTAFTGTAAFNIQGCTVHHAFRITRGLPLPYESLKEQTLSPLRAKLENLQILVIDEVSMIYKRLLYYIHERLVQIKRNKSPFGGVSVLAVGDFFQLPPVKQSKNERLYNVNTSYPIDYWNDFFSVVELDEIMRQKEDLEFAKVLNMMRTRTDDEPISDTALKMLRECEREGKSEDLHVFSTNKEVDLHNQDMLKYLQNEIIEIPAKDFKKDKASGKITPLSVPISKSDSDGLPTIFLMSEDARVMLTRNIDVQDGLVNGIMGTVHQIKKTNYAEKSKSEISAVVVRFDNKRVGRSAGKLSEKGNLVTIERIEEELRKSGTTRFQFPLKLAWACTAHKVQGMTLDRVVVDLKKVFSPGQAYVALSRVTSKGGLHLKSNGTVPFEKKIFADKEVGDKIKSMKTFSEGNLDVSSRDLSDFRVILFNVQRLLYNIKQMKTDQRFLSADAIMLTETWLTPDDTCDAVHIESLRFSHQSRYDSYTNSSDVTSKFKESAGGGVGIYVKETCHLETKTLHHTDIEGMVLKTEDKLQIIVVYRPQAYPIPLFVERLSDIISILNKNNEPCIILGDFNENILQNNGKIHSFMTSRNFRQVVTSATTENGTLIDHVYVTGNIDVTTKIIPTYYSDHEAVLVCVKFQNV